MSLRYPIGIIEPGQMIKRPITINAGEIKNSSQLLLLSFSDVNQCPSPISLTDWDCCVYLRGKNRFDTSKGGVRRHEEVKAEVEEEEEEEVVQQYQS